MLIFPTTPEINDTYTSTTGAKYKFDGEKWIRLFLTGYNKNFGTSAGDVCEGNDSRLSDNRTPVAHDIAGALHNASTLAQLNAKISDATLIDTNDSRLTDSRTPVAHDIAGALHNASTLAQLNAKISDATLIDTNDSRLSDARPASDVSSWAKDASKPTYTNTEVGAAATSHTHGSVTNDGKIGSTTNLVVVTGTDGVLATQSRSGIDSRSVYPPDTHTHDTKADKVIPETAGTLAGLDATGNLIALEIDPDDLSSGIDVTLQTQIFS